MKNNIYACLEIGCAEFRILVCNIREERLYVLSQQSVKASGIENGDITNANQVVEKLKELKVNVERDLQQDLQTIFLSIPSVECRIDNIDKEMQLDSECAINSSDIKQLFREIISQPTYHDQVAVNVLPRAFVIDDETPIQNPVGHTGDNLVLYAQKLTASASMVYNLINIAELAGFRIADIILGGIAETLYVVNAEQLRKGMCQINIGKDLTTITVVYGGKFISSVSLSIGGESVTKKISESFGVDRAVAEKIKLNFNYRSHQLMTSEIVYADAVDGRYVCITQQMLESIISEQYVNIFKIIKQYLRDQSYKLDEMDYIFTGGACQIDGFERLAKNVFGGTNVSRYIPTMLGVRDAKYVKLIGMATFVHEISLLTGQKSNIIDFSRYDNVSEQLPLREIEPESEKSPTQEKKSDKTFMDHKLENSGVLVRIFDMIFDEKAE